MPPVLPSKPIGFTIGAPNADVNLSCFLDYTVLTAIVAFAVCSIASWDGSDFLFWVSRNQCPYSGKMYKTITEIVCPAYAGKSFSFTFYNQVQP